MTLRHNLPSLFLAAAGHDQDRELFGAKRGESWSWISAKEALVAVREVASGLLASGLLVGDRVGLVSENRPEWLVSDLGVQFAAGVDVPIYPTLPAEQVAFLLRDSGARFVIVSSADQARKVLLHAETLPALRTIVLLDGQLEGTTPLAELRALGREHLATNPGMLEERLAGLGPGTLATIIYTSGTTGTPKGVMLTHGNFCSNIAASVEIFRFERGDRALSFLPISHVFERMVLYAYIEMGLSIAFIKGPEQLRDAMVEVRPHVFVTVPKVLEMVASRIRDAIDARSGLARNMGLKALRWAEDVADDFVNRKRPTGLRAVRFRIADRLVLSKLRERLGGRLKFMISGGAALSADVARFFWAAGVPVFEGYGMTETAPVIAVNRRNAVKLGTVGLPLPNVEVRIAADGEVLVRGPNVMQGYWNRPQETAEALVDGWMCTGDLGTFDADGFLRLTGRKKEILVLSTGKNVAPRAVEEMLEKSPFISRAVAVGDERPAVGVLIVPEMDRVLAWASEQNVQTSNVAALLTSSEVRRLYEGELHRLQGKLAAFEKARRFEFIVDQPTEENGLLTPTQKVRRHEFMRRYAQLVDRMYRQ